MLSRHNIRIKVLQSFYSYLQSSEPNAVTAENAYLKSIDQSFRLYLYNMLYIDKVCEYNKKDYDLKSRKLVPTEEDQHASLCLYENPIAKSIREDNHYQRLIKKEILAPLVDNDLVRRLYQNFAKSDYYTTYRQMQQAPLSEHQYALVKLYKTMLEDEVFVEHIGDMFPSWEDDQSLIYGAVKNTMRDLPAKEDDPFCNKHLPNEEFVHEFGKELLYQCIRHDKELQDLITPKLENWKEDRVALVDMILMKMALCELLYFPSIPTKVTINEYVSIAKDYSTDNSKRFVNGILDRLMKELREAGRIEKTGRGLQE